MKILFKTLEYKNFRSVGNTPVKIELNTNKTTLISGLNGSGKTTVMSALCFALFGRGYGAVSKPSLVNSINLKQLLVTLDFSIGKKEYKIVRGIKPNIFEIYEDGKLINQDPTVKDYQKVLEQQIIKINYRAFTQVVIVGGGSDYVPFMKLATKERRDFVEDLLDIRIFTTMNLIVREKLKTAKDDLKLLDSDLKAIKEKLLLQESFIKKLTKEKTENKEKIRASIDEYIGSVASLEAHVAERMIVLKDSKEKVSSYNEMVDQLDDLKSSLRSTMAELKKQQEKEAYYNGMDSCPLCHQSVEGNHKHNIVKGYSDRIAELAKESGMIKTQEDLLAKSIEEYEAHVDTFNMVSKEISTLQNRIASTQILIENAQLQLDEVDSDTSSLDVENAKIKDFAKEYVACDKKRKLVLKEQQYNEHIQQILSDSGIKSKIIKQYIPTINKLINHYLAELDFFVSFHLDEQFNETIKSRHRDQFTYENFSEGQKRRIDTAILMTWRDIAKAKNAINCNLMFLDEFDAPLDSVSSDMLQTMLRICSAENVFLISHKGDVLSDKVDSIIEFEIKNNFTQVKG